MPRICIAAVLAFLVLLAPAASARPLVQSERITDTGGSPAVVSERAHRFLPPEESLARKTVPTSSLAGTTDETTRALEQERYYASQGDAHAALVREEESTTGSGNQGAPRPDDDESPWAIVVLGIGSAALLAGGLTLAARRTRTRAGVAA